MPQGRRLWRSLTVDEHLRLVAGERRGAWTIERIYDTFPRLAERKSNAGSQLSGGEQQMLAISRALLLNPRLLVMDEPTEGLAPVIVAQVEDMLVRLAEDGEIAVLVIEQNIGVATEVADTVAIMVNGRINRLIEARELAADRDLQQRLLGVGRHGHEDTPAAGAAPAARRARAGAAAPPPRPDPHLHVEPEAADALVAAGAGGADRGAGPHRLGRRAPRRRAAAARRRARPSTAGSEPVVVVAGTLDTKGDELRFIRDILKEAGLRTRLVDLSTSGKPSGADVPPIEVALHPPARRRGPLHRRPRHRRWRRWRRRSRPGSSARPASPASSRPAARAARPWWRRPCARCRSACPRCMISTVASGNVQAYVGPSDIMMMYSVTDVQGLNSISRQVLANGAQAMAGMVRQRLAEARSRGRSARRRQSCPRSASPCSASPRRACSRSPPSSRASTTAWSSTPPASAASRWRSWSTRGLLSGVIDVTTTEICDMMMGGVFPATEDRFGAIIRARLPYVGSVGALDMVNFGAPETVPERYKGRTLLSAQSAGDADAHHRGGERRAWAAGSASG